MITVETALFAFKRHLKFGKALAIFIIVGITFGQWNSLMGILSISLNLIYEILANSYVKKQEVMREYKTSLGVYIGLFAALFFSLVISYNGILALLDYF